MKSVYLNNFNEFRLVDINFEEKFYLDNKKTVTIPFSFKWDTVGISLSGGLNSTLLLFLLVKTFQKQEFNVKIQPITFKFADRVDSSTNVPAIIDKIKEITGYTNINGSKFYSASIEESEDPIKKNEFFKKPLKDMIDNWEVDQWFNGNISNPPENIRSTMINNDKRHLSRDNPQSIYNTEGDASPLLLIDKADVIKFYINYDIIDSLAPLTISCDQKLSVILDNNLSVPCNQCWWCDTRKYGYSANNL